MKPEPEANTDAELERALLAALLTDNSAFDRLGPLEPEALADPMHAAALTAMLDLRAEGRAVNVITLRSRFAGVPFGESSVLDYLKACNANGATDVADIAASLRELSQRREIASLGERIAGSVHDHAVGPAALLTDAARQVDDLLAKCRPAGKTLWAMPEAVEVLLAAKDNAEFCVRTGLTDFDKATGGGLQRGDLAILGGRPSMGKSALGVSLGRRAAKNGHGVLLFSLEMKLLDCMRRMATDACWSRELSVAHEAARTGKLSERERRVYEAGARTLDGLPLLIEERSGLTLAEVAAIVRRTAEQFERQGKRLDLVIIDHIGFMAPSNRYRGNKVNEVGEISTGLQRLAKSEMVSVLALHQLNRATEGRDNKRPQLSDLRESGNIEQDADMVLFAYRSSYYLERMKFDDPDDEAERFQKLEATRNELEVAIAKQRNGPTCTVELFCNMAANAIRDKWRGS
jgi:replicative DNA helicase